jgi:hypothetical protein
MQTKRLRVPLLQGFGPVLRKELRGRSVLRINTAVFAITTLVVQAWYWRSVCGSLQLPRPAAMFRKDVLLQFIALSICVSSVGAAACGAAITRAHRDTEREPLILGGINPTAAAFAQLTVGAVPAVVCLTASLVSWSVAYGIKPAPELLKPPTYSAVVLAHIALLPAAVTAIAFTTLVGNLLRSLHAGSIAAAAGVAISAAAIVDVAALNPWLDSIHNPAPIINLALMANPVAGASGQLHYDVLREKYIYSHIKVHDYPFRYPELYECWLYSGAAVLACSASSLLLRRLHRSNQ